MRRIAALVSLGGVLLGQSVVAAASDRAAPPVPAITVALDGTGDFKSVQAAVDSVPAHNSSPITIHIKPGVYHERITVPADKPMISFVGEGAAKTVLTASANAHTLGSDGKEIGTFKSASTFIFADDFTAQNITFENASGNHGQALAIEVTGDRAVFRHCGFAGWQDTILVNAGRQYFEDCAISGHVDFIFGAATAFFNRCQIHCLAAGYITAASTPQDHGFGFVFSHCRVTADSGLASVYLGRPWRPYAAVVFMETELPDAIRSAGWFNWKDPAREKTARYSEYANTGPGAATEGRVAWSHQLSDADAKTYTVEKVLGGTDGWNPQPREAEAPETAETQK
jgi:pectinesterase